MMHDRGRHIGWVFRREVNKTTVYAGVDRDREWLIGTAGTLSGCATELLGLFDGAGQPGR